MKRFFGIGEWFKRKDTNTGQPEEQAPGLDQPSDETALPEGCQEAGETAPPDGQPAAITAPEDALDIAAATPESGLVSESVPEGDEFDAPLPHDPDGTDEPEDGGDTYDAQSGEYEEAPSDVAEPEERKSPLQWFKERRARILAVAGLAVLALVLFIGPLVNSANRAVPAGPVGEAPERYDVNLTEKNFQNTGVFILNGISGLSEEYLVENLMVFPPVEFEVHKYNENTAWVRLSGSYEDPYTVDLTLPAASEPLTWDVGPKPFTVGVVKSSLSPGESVYLTFSEEVTEDMLRRSLSIEPEVSYNINTNGTAAEISFPYPDNVSGAYTIKLATSFHSLGGKRLDGAWQHTVNIEKKVIEPKFTVRMTNRTVQIAPADRPIPVEFEAEMVNTIRETAVVLTMYRFDSVDKFLNQANLIAQYGLDPAVMLDRVGSDIHVLRSGLSSISLDNPGLGAFLIKAEYVNPLTNGTQTIYRPVMVTDISVYMQSTMGETLFWLNSGATSRPLNGYTVEILDADFEKKYVSGATDSDGVCVLATDRKDANWTENSAMRITDPDGKTVYVDRTNLVSWRNYEESSRYFSYFYLDRSIYKPTDTVSFWGFVRPHGSNPDPAPEEVRIVLDRGGLDYSVQAKVDANGIYHGELPLEQIKSANYVVEAVIPLKEPIIYPNQPAITDRALDYQYIEVKQYEKPTFQIDCSTDKELYNFDEDVTVTVRPTFYDGTPLPNYELELTVYNSYYGSAIKTEMFMTNSDGVGTAKFAAHPGNSETLWSPSTNRYQVRIISDGENIAFNGSYTYMPTDVMIVGEVRENASDDLTLRAQVNELKFSAIETPEQLGMVSELGRSYYYNSADYSDERYNFMRGAALDMEVGVDVKTNYRKTDGSYTTDKRHYTRQAVGGRIEVPFELPENLDANRGYYIEVTFSVKDKRGRTINYSQYYSSYRYMYPEGEGKTSPDGYSMAVTRPNGDSALEQYYEYINYRTAYFGDGERATLSLLYNGEPAENNGRMLYTVLQDKIIERGITASRSLSFTESTKWANNVNVVAAYFDGTHVYPVMNTVLYFDRQSALLNVEITPGKEKYIPGETARVNVKVTDKNGRGVAGNVCVSVVDEAVFALREQDVDVNWTLYNGLMFYNYYVNKYTTLTSRGLPENEGKGDIGKEDMENLAFYDMYRKNFKDTACFIPVRTDSYGNASVTFQLPDNTTSWRVTTVAVGDNLYGGNNKTNFASSLPFFVSPVISGKYIEGDDIAMLIQGHGTMLTAESEIDYTVRVTGDNTDLTQTAKNVAYKSNLMNFGKLPAGEYTVVATARYGGYSDTVEIPLAVVSSNLELVVSRRLDLSKPLADNVNAMRYPVTISFYDKEYSAYYKSVSSLLTHYCMIANQRMSRFVAKRALTKYMDPDKIPQHIRAGNDDASDMQNYDGGIGWNVGDASDVMLTMQVLLIAKDQFNLNSMAQYFERVISREGEYLVASKELVAASYLGLAYIGKPVTNQIIGMLSKSGLSEVEKAYYVAALAYAGETEKAKSYYNSYFTPNIVRSGQSAHVKAQGTDESGNDTLTKAVWLAASKLGLGDADAFALHFAEPGWRIGSLFECMAYVTNYDKAVKPASFTYFVGDRQYTEDLGVSGQRTISLSKSEFEQFKMGAFPDRLEATAYYIGEPFEAELNQSDKVRISKTVTQVSDGRYRVDLTLNLLNGAPTGQYDISDWVPSNMRFYDIERAGSWGYNGGKGWRYKSEGQKLYFTVYRYDGSPSTTIKYYIQKTYDAEAMMDSTYVIHGNSGESAFSPRYEWKG